MASIPGLWKEVALFPDMPAGEVAWMCAAPMGMIAGRRAAAGRGCAGGVGGGPGQPPGGGAGPGVPAVRVLRAGLDRGLAGSGDVAGPAAAAGGDAGGRARGDRGGVLRHGGEPGPAVGAAPAGRRPGRAAGGPGPRVGRDRDRGVRAGVLRQPVRVDGAAVRALRHRAVDAGSRRAGRLARRGPRADHARARPVVQAGDHPDPDPGPHRDGRPDPGAGTVPGRPPAVRVPARRCRSAPEQGARRVGPARAPARTGPGDRAGRARGCSPSGWPGTAPPGSPAP